ncbi:hypothetical protein K439DRAFT_1625286 [Ramaria rubella]|nr:hypothetical protein K439DRAFT_1625286 [Ramaria rubella]
MYLRTKEAMELANFDSSLTAVLIPLSMIVDSLPINLLSEILTAHNIPCTFKQKVEELGQVVHSHDEETCMACSDYTCVFVPVTDHRKKAKKCQPVTYQRKSTSHVPPVRPNLHRCTTPSPFPLQPNSATDLEEDVTYSFCQATTPSALQEVGCAVCGMLVPQRKAVQMKKTSIDYGILTHIGHGTTHRKKKSAEKRKESTDEIQELEGPHD